MDLTISKKELVRVLSKTVPATDAKGNAPFSNKLLLQADGAQLRVTGSNIFVTARTTGTAKVKRAGAVVVLARKLAEAVRTLHDGIVHIAQTKDGNAVHVKSGGARFKLPVSPADEYPPFAEFGGCSFRMGSSAFVALLKKAGYARSSDDTRPHLCSIRLEVENETTVRAVTVDGHRLATQRGVCSDGQQDWSVSIDGKMAASVMSIASELEGDLSVAADEHYAHFRWADTHVSVRIVEEPFPPWRRMVPLRTAVEIAVSRDLLLDAIKRATIAANAKYNSVVVEIGDGKLSVSSEDQDVEASDSVDVAYSGDKLRLGAGAGYLAEAVAQSDDDEVVIKFNGELDPICLGSIDDEMCAVVMPMKVD